MSLANSVLQLLRANTHVAISPRFRLIYRSGGVTSISFSRRFWKIFVTCGIVVWAGHICTHEDDIAQRTDNIPPCGRFHGDSIMNIEQYLATSKMHQEQD